MTAPSIEVIEPQPLSLPEMKARAATAVDATVPGGITFTVLTNDNGRVSKRVVLVDGVPKKIAGRSISRGTAEVRTVATLAEFAKVRASLRPEQALTYGVPKAGDCRVGSKDYLQHGEIARTADNWQWTATPTLLALDGDEGTFSRDEIVAAIKAALGQDVDALWTPSATGYVVNALEDKVFPKGGHRVYIPIDDPSQMQRVSDALLGRLAIAGYGTIRLTADGRMLRKSLIDACMPRAEHLDYGAADVGEALFIAVNAAKHYPGSQRMISANLIADLSDDEQRQIDDAYRPEETRLEPDAAKCRAVVGAVGGAGARMAPLSHVIRLSDFTERTIGEILADDSLGDAIECFDPWEPDLTGDRRVATIFRKRENGRRPAIFSFLHNRYWTDIEQSDAERMAGFSNLGPPAPPNYPMAIAEAQTVAAIERAQASARAAGQDVDALADARRVELQPLVDDGRPDDTEQGYANLLVSLAGGNLRYVVETGEAIDWNGRQWIACGKDGGAVLHNRALEVGEHHRRRELLAEKALAAVINDLVAATAEDQQTAARDRYESVIRQPPKEREFLSVRAAALDAEMGKRFIDAWTEILAARRAYRECRTGHGLAAIKKLALHHGHVAISADQLDTHRHLLGVANGVVDLRTGELRPGSRDDLMTQSTPVAFDPAATCPRWTRFIDEIAGLPDGHGFTPRPEFAAYLHRMAGYWITGEVRDQKLFMLTGEGSNGKSLLCEIVEAAMGPLWRRASTGFLMASQRDTDDSAATPGLAALAGARVAFISETRKGSVLDVADTKRVTGEPALTARPLYGRPFTFVNHLKPVLLTNDKPGGELDSAMAGRLQIVEFMRRWNRPDAANHDPALPDADKTLGAALKAELPGILAWLVRGAVRYYAEGLNAPADVAEAGREYVNAQDSIARWLDSGNVVDADPGVTTGWLPVGVLHSRYQSWCEANLVRYLSRDLFAVGMSKSGKAVEKTARATLYALKAAAGADPFDT